jgi:hypothetical protein
LHVSDDAARPWVPAWFRHPGRSELATGHHLRPLRAADDGLPGLPPSVVLPAVVAAAEAGAAYVYGLFDDEERSVLGLVTLAPAADPHDADVVWRLTAGAGGVGAVLPGFLETWLDQAWPFRAARVSEA